MERPARYKHSSLISPFINYEELLSTNLARRHETRMERHAMYKHQLFGPFIDYKGLLSSFTHKHETRLERPGRANTLAFLFYS
jgi:hypothetical protein